MPFIDRDFINDLSNRVDIVSLINKRVALKKAGKDYKACCPFHEEKTPSFTVVPSKQIFHCFGCGESGGVIDFIKKFDHLGFVEAVEAVSGESGISVVYDQTAKPVDSRFKRFNNLMMELSDFYQSQLKQSATKKKAIDYAKKRAISGSIAKRFELGYAPSGWSNLYENYKSNEESLADLVTMGMLVSKKDKKSDYYDRFRDRLMFPIHNAKGNVIAFGGRVLSNKDNPKYLNSPETPLFSKSKELYGLYHCRKYSRRIDYILVVEGYMDVIALHQQGITSAVATLGTATTPAHLQTLSRSTDTIVFCFDGDKAGRAAAWKALQTSLPVIKAGLVIKFLILPEGEDPDTLIKLESSKSFTKRIEAAQTLSSFLFDHIKSEVPFETIEGKTLFLEKSASIIHRVSYPIYRQQLIEGVAQTIGQDVSYVEKALAQSAQSKRPAFDRRVNEINDFTDRSPGKLLVNTNSNITNLMAKMIRCVLNYPSLVNDPETSMVIKERVNSLPDSWRVLKGLIHSAQDNPDNVTSEDLIKPYEDENEIFLRLKELSIMDARLSENEAWETFSEGLTKAEKQQENRSIKADIKLAQTPEKQKKVMDRLTRNKISSDNNKKS